MTHAESLAPPVSESTDLERRVLARERILQALIAYMARTELNARIPQIRDTLEQRAARRAFYRRTIDELQACSDRDLADLGSHRSDIPRVGRQTAAKV